MRNKGGVFLRGLALWLVLVLFLSPALAQTVNARFSAGSQITWPIAYSDAYFARSGREYHHDTALSSLGMALSGFETKGQQYPRLSGKHGFSGYQPDPVRY